MGGKKKKDNKNEVNIRNKKASFEFELLEKYEAGIQLTGQEIKSIREGKASIKEAYCMFHKGELYVKNMHISEYGHGRIEEHEPRRLRKLLLHKQELKKLGKKVKERGQTIVPIKLYIGKKGFAKLLIALAKGKQKHDKREALKRKDDKRQMERAKKQYKMRG
ncbi:MAG: SsrA-binding protein SmpB [Flavobacteriales bacterium]